MDLELVYPAYYLAYLGLFAPFRILQILNTMNSFPCVWGNTARRSGVYPTVRITRGMPAACMTGVPRKVTSPSGTLCKISKCPHPEEKGRPSA
jgi:hypothetical protein